MTTISISIDTETKQEIDKIAKDEKRSKSDVIRAAFKSYVFNKNLEYFQNLAKPTVERENLRTEEDFERYLG